MERDWDLIRRILLLLEALPDTAGRLAADQVDGYDSDIVSYHLQILGQAGLVEVRCTKDMSGSIRCFAISMTWAGHEFLDGIKSQTAWNSVRTVVREKGAALSFEVIKAAGGHLVSQMFK
ncbi:DUF2513 domain-containing protein [Robbsia andropogonis]|uniref:DUF2513 domain-containing protein n=1 Tax=Robbsia andropogonis TaxID=28092 RepID=UPI003D211CD5